MTEWLERLLGEPVAVLTGLQYDVLQSTSPDVRTSHPSTKAIARPVNQPYQTRN